MLVFLIGFMGSGKSTVGKKLAKKLNYDFIDLDAAIEKQENCSISNIFENKGESLFREIEKDVLCNFLTKENTVIACGGGTPCYFDNMELMNQFGLTVYLKLSIDALVNRLVMAKQSRPLINNLPPEQLKTFIQSKLVMREPIYQKAKVICNGININIIELIDILKQKNSSNTN